jgi:glycosyltransferase involved in cell wall biosynthesis
MKWALPALVTVAGIALLNKRIDHEETARQRTEVERIRQSAVGHAVAQVRQGTDEPFVAIVIAARNEGPSIDGVLAEIPQRVCALPTRVIVVDDGSTDDTGPRAAEAGAIVVRHPVNLGQADGLRTGFACAFALGATVVVTMDADGQHDPADLPALVQPVLTGTVDYVQGSRFLGKYDDRRSARHAGIVAFTVLINALTDAGITDCTNGYRAVRASDLERMRLVEGRFNASEIIIEAKGKGLRMLEIPVHIRSRDAGVSKKPKGLGYPVGYFNSIVRSWLRSKSSNR